MFSHPDETCTLTAIMWRDSHLWPTPRHKLLPVSDYTEDHQNGHCDVTSLINVTPFVGLGQRRSHRFKLIPVDEKGTTNMRYHCYRFSWIFKEEIFMFAPCNNDELFIIQLMHNIQIVDTIKIIKYLKVLQHVSGHRGSIIREPRTVHMLPWHRPCPCQRTRKNHSCNF